MTQGKNSNPALEWFAKLLGIRDISRIRSIHLDATYNEVPTVEVIFIIRPGDLEGTRSEQPPSVMDTLKHHNVPQETIEKMLAELQKRLDADAV